MNAEADNPPPSRLRNGASLPRRSLGARFLHQMLVPLLIAFLVAAASGILISHMIVHNEVEARRQMILDIHVQSLALSLRDCDRPSISRSIETLTRQSIVTGLQLDSSCPGSPFLYGAAPDSSAGAENYFARNITYIDEQGVATSVGRLEVEFEALVLWGAVVALLWRYMLMCALMIMVMMFGALIAFRQVVS